MIKITKPGNFHHPSPHHHPAGPHQHLHGPPHHPHFHGRRRRHTPPTPIPSVPNPDFIQQVQAQIPQWLPNRENTEHIRTHIEQHLNSLKTNIQPHMRNSKQYLESVGQYLQQALSPFGIDCDFHVDEKKPSTTEEQPETTTTTTTTTEEQHEEVTTTDTVPTSEPDAVSKYPDLSEDNKDNNKQEQITNSSTPLIEEEFTEITNPLESNIDNCMERMKAMGFIDANGALRELVRSKQGDINAVLDAINPRHYQA
jgi:hypothetical protein